jgi:hypothetical protein
MMTLPRTAAQVLSGHVRLEVRCVDRVLLTFRQPRLQYGPVDGLGDMDGLVAHGVADLLERSEPGFGAP